MKNEKNLHTKTGVHPHDFALPGQDNDKIVAVPALSAMWFSHKDEVAGAPHSWLSLSPSPRQKKTMTDKPSKARPFMSHCTTTSFLMAAS